MDCQRRHGDEWILRRTLHLYVRRGILRRRGHADSRVHGGGLLRRQDRPGAPHHGAARGRARLHVRRHFLRHRAGDAPLCVPAPGIRRHRARALRAPRRILRVPPGPLQCEEQRSARLLRRPALPDDGHDHRRVHPLRRGALAAGHARAHSPRGLSHGERSALSDNKGASADQLHWQSLVFCLALMGVLTFLAPSAWFAALCLAFILFGILNTWQNRRKAARKRRRRHQSGDHTGS